MIAAVCLALVGFQTASPTISVLPITFDGNFSEADTTPLRNSLRHALKANLKPVVVRDVLAPELTSGLAKAGLKGTAMPLKQANLDKLRVALGAPFTLQVRITGCTIKMQTGASKPTFNATMSATYWVAPFPKRVLKPGTQVVVEGVPVSVTTPAPSVLMDKPTMHRMCGLLMKELATKLKAPLGAK